jgi:hypothetical protein
MCTSGRGKLVSVADELDDTYSELRKTREKLIEEKNARELAEDNYNKVCQRNMRLTATADTSILWMMFATTLCIIQLSFLVYVL